MSKVIEKKEWISSFNIVGAVKITDYTFKIDELSTKSNWRYNSMNLGIDVGDEHGIVFCNMMGGFFDVSNKKNVCYAHGKKEDGTDDFSAPIEVAWEDRKEEKILEQIGDLSFVTVGIEKQANGKTFYKKFLSGYDAIEYIKDNIEDGMVVNVRGNLKYSEYQGDTQVQKNIQSIALSKAKPNEYKAVFTQSILLNKDSANPKTNIDKEAGILYIDGRVLDYAKEIEGKTIKGQYPFDKQFEFMIGDDIEMFKKKYNKLFKVKKDVTQINFDGEFFEGGSVVTMTWDDVPEDVKELVEFGIKTKEEVLATCSGKSGRKSRMVVKSPHIKIVKSDDGESQTPVIQIYEQRYKEEDLFIDLSDDTPDFMDIPEDAGDELPFDDVKTETKVESKEVVDWLDSI